MFPKEEGLEAEFTFESERGGVIEEPPFRILMLGNWSGDGEKRVLRERRPIEIDRDNFDEVIERLGVQLNLGDSVSLSFRSLDDFHPDEIFRQVPMFTELRDLRKRLKDQSTFNEAAREVRSWSGLQDAPVQPAENMPASEPVAQPSGNILDTILSNPAGGAPAPSRGATGELGALVSDLVRPHLVSVDENEQRSMLNAVDEATSGLMRKILHDRRFQELEAAWRGLFFQVRRTETDTDLKIYILDISKEELGEDLKASRDLSDSYAFRIIVETDRDEPWALMCGDYAFAPTVDDAAALVRLAKLAAASKAPFVSHMRPDIFGVHSLAEDPDYRNWEMSTNFDAGALWATLRGMPEAKYLGMTMPRFLARLPYGADTEPLEAFSFGEFAAEPVHDDYLWTNGCFLVATLLARSYSSHGWEMGQSMIQDVEDLPLHMYKQGTETVYQPCGEILLSQTACDRLMDYGLMPLVSYKNTDRIKVARFQSISEPVTGLRGRWSQSEPPA
jgi:type VI secretion system protein ImpC